MADAAPAQESAPQEAAEAKAEAAPSEKAEGAEETAPAGSHHRKKNY
jgi:hypothetical protein